MVPSQRTMALVIREPSKRPSALREQRSKGDVLFCPVTSHDGNAGKYANISAVVLMNLKPLKKPVI